MIWRRRALQLVCDLLGPAVSRWRARFASMISSPNFPRRVAMSLVDFDRRVYRLEYPWVCTDGGRSSSARPKQQNDCTVRALAIARDLPYDEAYDILKDAGRKSGRGFDFVKWVASQPWATKISFPAVKGKRRMTPAQFCRDYPKGIFILRVTKHLIAVRDGVIYDAFENRPDRCVYAAWAVGLT